jgi:hypothetical protein
MAAALDHRDARDKTFEIFGDDTLAPEAWRESFKSLKSGCFDRPTCGLMATAEPR